MVAKLLFALLVLAVALLSYAMLWSGVFLGIGSIIYLLAVYNRLAILRHHVLERTSNIETEIARKLDLFERIYDIVAKSMTAETGIIREVANIRSGHHRNSEAEIDRGMRLLNAVAESNPEIRFSENYMELQQEVAATETAVQESRERLNEAVRIYNTFLSVFPNNVMASVLPFREVNYYTR
jgi:LemA protein